MALITKSIKGTQDILPSESHKVRFVEQTALEIAGNCGFREIRIPVFEHTELFQRGVGDTTDVVQKEMYTFLDKGERSITLRPEGTASVVRSGYEKPQAGRLREFHQFGLECLGTASPAADAEVISVANDIFSFLGVRGIKLEINSIGCPECRKEYHKALHDYFAARKDELCHTCQDRLERNPMRILDCKSPICSEIAKDAPKVTDFLCDDCKAHFEAVQSYLKAMEIPFTVNPTIVRGLDYYTRTVFEFVSTEIGAQGTVCGGGRYDGLVEEIGGAHTPALGFGMGIERLMLLMEKQNLPFPEREKCALYIATMGEKASFEAAKIASALRREGVEVQFDVVGRSVKAQMKYANKLGAAFTVVLGDSELESGVVKLKNMESGEETEVALSDFENAFMRASLSESLKGLEDLGVETDIDIDALMNKNLF